MRSGVRSGPQGKQKNHYVAYNGSQYFYIPSGVDQTFQCPHTYGTQSGQLACPQAVECFADEACGAQYDAARKRVDGQSTREHACPNWRRTVLIATLVPSATGALLLLLGLTKAMWASVDTVIP